MMHTDLGLDLLSMPSVSSALCSGERAVGVVRRS
jgi:hypothetical protein